MKAKQIYVNFLNNSTLAQAAAEYINKLTAESIGSAAFNESEEAHIIGFIEAEIASCDEFIRENLRIEIEEIEIEEDE